ncbi:MAG: hypothetical protein ACRD0K_08240 [Egibacteraceae bacterium]
MAQTPARQPRRRAPGGGSRSLDLSRLTLHPPCACPPIPLARDAPDLASIHDLSCHACGIGYQIAFLGDSKRGLWVSWREQPPAPDHAGADRLLTVTAPGREA